MLNVNSNLLKLTKNFKLKSKQAHLNNYHLGDRTEKYIHNLFENKFEWIKANLKDIVQKIENYKHKE